MSKILSNGNTYVNIILSDKSSYNQLKAAGIAGAGDLVVTRAEPGFPHGVMWSHNHPYYFADPELEENLTHNFDKRYVKPDVNGNVKLTGSLITDKIVTNNYAINTSDGPDIIMTVTADKSGNYVASYKDDVILDAQNIQLAGNDLNDVFASIYEAIRSGESDADYQGQIDKLKSDVSALDASLAANFAADASVFNFANVNVSTLVADLQEIHKSIADTSAAIIDDEYVVAHAFQNVNASINEIKKNVSVYYEGLTELTERTDELSKTLDDTLGSISPNIKEELIDYINTSVGPKLETQSKDITDIQKLIEDNEEVIAYALTNLTDNFNELQNNLSAVQTI